MPLTLFLLCATYVGWPRQASRPPLLRKTSKHPTEKFMAAVWERQQLTESWQRRLFIWTSLPLLENKRLIWQHSGRTGRPFGPSPSTSIPSHICRQSGRLHNIHKHFSLLFCVGWRFSPSAKVRRDFTSLRLTSSLKVFILQSYTLLRHVDWDWSANSGSQSPTFWHLAISWVIKGLQATVKLSFFALCHTSVALYLVFKRIAESFQNQNRSEVRSLPCKCSLRQAVQAQWAESRLFLFAFLIHSKSIYLYT